MGTTEPTSDPTTEPSENPTGGPSSASDAVPEVAPRPRARESLVDRPTEHIEADVCALAGRLAAGTYELLVLIGELDHRGDFAVHGSLSCAAWLAELCDIDISTARRQVRVARTMRQHQVLDQAMARGDISYAKARALSSYITSKNAEELVRIASVTPASELGIAISRWSHSNEDEEAIEARQHAARSVSWRTDPDGCVVITARLTPAVAGEVCAVIDAQVNRVHAPAGASLPQQRADALHTVVARPAPAPTGDGDGPGTNVTAEVVVHVTEDGNHLPDGTPLTDHAVTSMLPRSFVSLLLNDRERHPIDLSPRRRFPNRRQRLLLEARQRQCAHPGCTATAFLQADHVEAWAKGGLTTLDNLQLLCGPHNRAKERHGAS